MKKVLFFLILLLGLITFSPRKALADTGSFDATNVAWTDKTVTFTVANSAPNAQPAFSDVCLKNYPYDSGNFACTQNFTVNWPTVSATFTQDLINAQVLIGLNSNLWYISNQSFNLPHYDNGSFDATNVTWANNTVTFTVANSAPNAQPAFSDVCLGNVPYGTGHDQCTQVFDTSNWPTVSATFTANYLSGTHTLWLNSSPFWYISNQSFDFPASVPNRGFFDTTNVTWSNNSVTFTVANAVPYFHPSFSDICLKYDPYDTGNLDSGNFACTQNFTVNWPTVTATFTQDLINAQVFIFLNSNPLWYASNQSFDLYTNTPPSVSSIPPATKNEGDTYSYTGSFTDTDSTSWTATVDYGDGGGAQPLTLSSTNFSLSHVYQDNRTYTVTVSVTDNQGTTGTGTATITVNNVAPSVGTISASVNPIQVNTATTASATFTDPGVLDTHTASWNWGDGNTTTGTVTETNGSVSDSHTYTAAGVYPITLTVTDKDGGQGTQTFQYLSVYNPTPQGLFSAGQKYTSPAGAYLQDTSLTGTVHFGLSYKYQGTVPTGNRQFSIDFNAADLHFNATTISSLVISNGIGTLTGTGTLTGSSNAYNFLVTGSESANTIRIQITDPANNNNVIYDTQPGDVNNATPTTTVTAGNVLAH